MSYDELLRDMERALVAIDASKPYRYEPTTSLPALSPQMQAALGAEAEMVASVVKRAREMEAELLAARERIAKLEQEPPMAMIDFGYGLDLQGIRDDLKFLDDVRRENRQLRAEVERLRADIDFQKRMTDAWADVISDQVKEATAMRRDLAEAIYLLRVFGFCTEADPDHELLLVERRQKLLDRHP